MPLLDRHRVDKLIALTDLDDAQGFQRLDGLAHRAPADAQVIGKLAFRRQEIARAKLPIRDELLDLVLNGPLEHRTAGELFHEIRQGLACKLHEYHKISDI